MPVQNIGNDIIDAYLQGLQIRKRGEEFAKKAQLEDEELKLKQERAKEETRQFDENMKHIQEQAKRQKEIADRQLEFNVADLKMKGRQQIAQGLIQPNLIPSSPEQAQAGLNEIVNTGRTSIPPYTKGPVELSPGVSVEDYNTPTEFGQEQVNRVGPVEKLKQGIGADKLLTQFLQKQSLEKTKAEGITERGENLEGIRHQNRLKEIAARNAGKESKEIPDTDFLINDFKTGHRTLQDLPTLGLKGPQRLKLLNEANLRGVRPLDRKQVEHLNSISTMITSFDKFERLNNAYKEKGRLGAAFSGDVAALEAEARSEAEKVARAANGLRGAATEGDIQRILGGIPQMMPGGARSLLSSPSEVVKINDRRLKDFKDSLVRMKEGILSGIQPEQKTALEERYGLNKVTKSPSRPKTIIRNGHNYLWDGSKYVLSGKAK